MRLMDKIMQVVQMNDKVVGNALVKRVTLNGGKMRGYVDNSGKQARVEHIGNGCWRAMS